MANNYISDLTTPEAIQRIWEKGIIVDGYNASLYRLNPEKPDVPLNKNDAFQKVQKRRVQEKR